MEADSLAYKKPPYSTIVSASLVNKVCRDTGAIGSTAFVAVQHTVLLLP
jgi:hypothetical protein